MLHCYRQNILGRVALPLVDQIKGHRRRARGDTLPVYFLQRRQDMRWGNFFCRSRECVYTPLVAERLHVVIELGRSVLLLESPADVLQLAIYRIGSEFIDLTV